MWVRIDVDQALHQKQPKAPERAEKEKTGRLEFDLMIHECGLDELLHISQSDDAVIGTMYQTIHRAGSGSKMFGEVPRLKLIPGVRDNFCAVLVGTTTRAEGIFVALVEWHYKRPGQVLMPWETFTLICSCLSNPRSHHESESWERNQFPLLTSQRSPFADPSIQSSASIPQRSKSKSQWRRDTRRREISVGALENHSLLA